MGEIGQEISKPLENALKVAKEYLAAISQWIIDFVTAIQNGIENRTEGFHFTQMQLLCLIGIIVIICFLIAKKHNKQNQPEVQQANTALQPTNKTKRVIGKTWYPTGWTYNEKTKLWEPPDYLIAESYERWVWDDEKGIWIDLYKKKKK